MTDLTRYKSRWKFKASGIKTNWETPEPTDTPAQVAALADVWQFGAVKVVVTDSDGDRIVVKARDADAVIAKEQQLQPFSGEVGSVALSSRWCWVDDDTDREWTAFCSYRTGEVSLFGQLARLCSDHVWGARRIQITDLAGDIFDVKCGPFRPDEPVTLNDDPPVEDVKPPLAVCWVNRIDGEMYRGMLASDDGWGAELRAAIRTLVAEHGPVWFNDNVYYREGDAEPHVPLVLDDRSLATAAALSHIHEHGRGHDRLGSHVHRVVAAARPDLADAIDAERQRLERR